MSLIYTVPAASGQPRNSIYIGGKNDAKSLDRLGRWGISHILNVTPTKDTSIQSGVPNFFEKATPRRFVYKRIPVYDASTSAPELEEHSSDIVQFITRGLFHGSVLVHCHHGVSRSTTCVVLYLMSKAGMTLKDAMMLIKRRRPEAEPIPAFLDLLERFEQTCNTSSGHKRKTKKQLQVIGPTIGPSVGPRTIGPSIGPSWVVSEKDAITTTSATTLSKKKKRKRMVGPFRGPSLEYTLSPNEVQIGPTLPRTKPAPQASNDTSDPNIGPQLPSDPSTTSNIGPQLPSDPSTTLLPLIDSTTTNANAAADSLNGVMSISNKTEVGPQLPE